MKVRRIAGYAAGVALFYGTVGGVCQSIPAAGPASGRTTIQFIVTGAKSGGATPKSCQDVLAVLLPDIQAYPHPDGWTWIVACDEPAWAAIQRHEGNQVGSGILAITNRPARSTIIRGSAMLRAFSNDFRAQPEHVVAHELCHIYLQSSDEDKVDALATRWVAERAAKHLAVLVP